MSEETTKSSTTPETQAPEVQSPETAAAPTDLASRAKTPDESSGVRLSEKAAEKVREHIDKEELGDGTYLYMGVKGGGCSGLEYILDLRSQEHAPVGETDEVFHSHGVTIVSDLKSFVVGNLDGTLIDWQETMMGAGFTFVNPNARHTCGCGSSYSA
jgi:iron-sulfur cluster assembly accessory protein